MIHDLSHCTDCESCLEISPTVFRKNPDAGIIEVMDASVYPEDEVDEAIAVCPGECICWDEP